MAKKLWVCIAAVVVTLCVANRIGSIKHTAVLRDDFLSQHSYPCDAQVFGLS